MTQRSSTSLASCTLSDWLSDHEGPIVQLQESHSACRLGAWHFGFYTCTVPNFRLGAEVFRAGVNQCRAKSRGTEYAEYAECAT